MNSDESRQLQNDENHSLAQRDDLLAQYDPNQNRYLSRFGFTSSLPSLMGDVNYAMSRGLHEEPSAVELTLRPHASVPQINLETTYNYGQPVNLYFQGSKVRLQIGKIPQNYAIENYEKLSRHVASYTRVNAELTEPEDLIHGGPHLTLATLEDLQDFVHETVPDKKVTLSAKGTYNIRRRYLTKGNWVAKTYPRDAKVEEDFFKLTQAKFNRLPHIIIGEARSPYQISVEDLREPFLLADIWSLRLDHPNTEFYSILPWPVSFDFPETRKFGRNVFHLNCIIYSASSPTGGPEIENLLLMFTELKRKGDRLLRIY